jgi:hypothetical protein
MTRIRLRPSSAHALALVALFVALGSASYAAAVLPANSVGSKQIRTGAVGTAAVKNRSLTRRDFSPGTLAHGAKGDTGPRGDTGSKGDTGPQGSARAFAFVDAGSCDAAGANCPILKGKNVLSARRVEVGGDCVQVASGINPATSMAAAGVDFRTTGDNEQEATAQSDSANALCGAGEFEITTTRNSVLRETTPKLANDVGFWILVP